MSQKSVLEKCLQKSPKICRKKVSWIFFVCAATCGKGLLNKDSQKSVLEKCPQKSPKICRKKVSWIFCMCGHLWEGSLCGGPDSDHSWVEILRGHTVEKSGAQHKSGEKPSSPPSWCHCFLQSVLTGLMFWWGGWTTSLWLVSDIYIDVNSGQFIPPLHNFSWLGCFKSLLFALC